MREEKNAKTVRMQLQLFKKAFPPVELKVLRKYHSRLFVSPNHSIRTYAVHALKGILESRVRPVPFREEVGTTKSHLLRLLHATMTFFVQAIFLFTSTRVALVLETPV